jgi:hypothetical protein
MTSTKIERPTCYRPNGCHYRAEGEANGEGKDEAQTEDRPRSLAVETPCLHRVQSYLELVVIDVA